MSYTAPVSEQRLALNAVAQVSELDGGPDCRNG
jgi:hypothetical protein